MPDEPLIWTTKGNILRSSVEQRAAWHHSPDDPVIALKLTYVLPDDEVVREDLFTTEGCPAELTDPAALIWTTNGNILRSSLEREVTWEDAESNVVVKIAYRLIETGEVVRQDAHAYVKQGLQLATGQAAFA